MFQLKLELKMSIHEGMSFMRVHFLFRPMLWLSVAVVVGLLSGCQRHIPLPECATLVDQGIGPGWTVDEASGTATHLASGLVWYRCLGGERFSDNQCLGNPLEINLEEATDYALAIAETSGKPWRLPTLREMQQIRQKHCQNPAVNKALFPSVYSSNHWTSSVSRNGITFGCATNTFNGNGYCREKAVNELPFLMVTN
jgi:hypothetical protein